MPRMTDEKWNEFLKRIGEGRSARDVCGNDKDMPSWRIVSIKLNEDSLFAQKYSLAMENRGQVYADKISDIINQVVEGNLDPNAGRVAIDGLKWMSMILFQVGKKIEKTLFLKQYPQNFIILLLAGFQE